MRAADLPASTRTSPSSTSDGCCSGVPAELIRDNSERIPWCQLLRGRYPPGRFWSKAWPKPVVVRGFVTQHPISATSNARSSIDWRLSLPQRDIGPSHNYWARLHTSLPRCKRGFVSILGQAVHLPEHVLKRIGFVCGRRHGQWMVDSACAEVGRVSAGRSLLGRNIMKA